MIDSFVKENHCFERMAGVAEALSKHETKIAHLERWRFVQTGAIAAILSLTSFVGTIAALWQFLKHVKP